MNVLGNLTLNPGIYIIGGPGLSVNAQGASLGGSPAGIPVGASADAPPAPSSDPLDRLKKLNDLRQAGALTDAEFEAQKAKLLGEI